MTPIAQRKIEKIPVAVWLLASTSLLNDISSELIAAVLPLYLATIGASGLGIGLIAGLEEVTRSLLSLFTGYRSDQAKRRIPFVMTGYGISALAKTLIAFSFSWFHVLGLRIVDRAGKAIRTPARDALLAALSSDATRGLIFGIHRAFDTAGALLGSLIALFAVWVLNVSDFSTLIFIGGIIGFSSIFPLLAIREEAGGVIKKKAITLSGSLKALPKRYYRALVGLALFAAGNISYMFMLLAVNASFSDKLAIGVPLLMYVIFNLCYAALAVPFGRLSDRLGRQPVLIAGFSIFSLVSLGFAFSQDTLVFVMLFLLYGVAFALFEANQRAWAADLVPEGQRGLALGLFQVVIGFSALIGNGLAGWLWQSVSPSAAFITASGLALLAAVTLIAMVRNDRKNGLEKSIDKRE